MNTEERITELEAQLAYERSWKEANAAQAAKLTETVESLAAQLAEAKARAKNLEQGMAWLVEVVFPQAETNPTPDPEGWIAEARRVGKRRNEITDKAEAERDSLRAALKEAILIVEAHCAEYGDYGPFNKLQATLSPEARQPHTHYCQHCTDRWECTDDKCKAGEVRGCPDARQESEVKK